MATAWLSGKRVVLLGEEARMVEDQRMLPTEASLPRKPGAVCLAKMPRLWRRRELFRH